LLDIPRCSEIAYDIPRKEKKTNTRKKREKEIIKIEIVVSLKL
jgi:hypothetical protein